MKSSSSADPLREHILDQCQNVIDHTKLLRDYATTPRNVWLARTELNQINQCLAEIEGLLTQLKEAD